jgi:hypothetical protein
MSGKYQKFDDVEKGENPMQKKQAIPPSQDETPPHHQEGIPIANAKPHLSVGEVFFRFGILVSTADSLIPVCGGLNLAHPTPGYSWECILTLVVSIVGTVILALSAICGYEWIKNEEKWPFFFIVVVSNIFAILGSSILLPFGDNSSCWEYMVGYVLIAISHLLYPIFYNTILA